MPSRPNVLVVGGGISGLTAALNLAQRNVHVTLVERAAALGGRSRTVCCKAIGGQCQLCGACLLADRIASVTTSDRVRVLAETTLSDVTRNSPGFRVSLVAQGSPVEPILADAIILATGFDHVDARSKGPYGFGILPGVTTGEEMERILKEQGQDAFSGLGLQKVAFIQCVGSRDEHVGRGYCSQVCCRYAIRLARLLRARIPDLDVTIFKMDIQCSGRDFQAAYQAAPNEGIHLVAGLPAVIRRSVANPGRTTFLYDDILAGRVTQQDFDLIVLATGIQPAQDAGEVANLLSINRDPFGFFATGPEETTTIAPGVFVAGCCQAPRSIAESVAHAQRAAEACYAYVREMAS
ncbi:MAG: FAD-dependent oxidoreductase [Anaerolineae bacterium]